MTRAASVFALAALAVFSIPSLVARAQQDGVHAPGGGTHTSVESIFIPPMPNAPFTATVSTTWVRVLDDGSTVTLQNHRTVARDNSGRIFEQRRYLVPEGDPRENLIHRLEYADPSTHQIYYCEPMKHACEIYNYFPRTEAAPLAPAGPFDGGRRFLTRTELGNDTIGGVEVIGTRETTTINAGAAGNDRAISIVKEFWFSPQLGINVIEKRQDPRVGTQTFTVSEISLGEPDARFFDMPSSYRIVDTRKPTSPATQDSAAN
jgi:hypothetical protein